MLTINVKFNQIRDKMYINSPFFLNEVNEDEKDDVNIAIKYIIIECFKYFLTNVLYKILR